MIEQIVKKKIKEVMDAKNISVKELAKKAGITEPCIRNWYGKRNCTPSLEVIGKVSKALDIDETLLFNYSENKVYLTEEERRFLTLYYALDSRQQESINQAIKSFIDRKNNSV